MGYYTISIRFFSHYWLLEMIRRTAQTESLCYNNEVFSIRNGISTGENIATFLGHPTDVQCLAFSPDSTILASGGFDGVIYLWDLKPYTISN